jgi:DHA2 family multidrug resistance protein
MAESVPAPANGGGKAKPLEGTQLYLGAGMLALVNFVVVLDMTIANVSVPHIAGGLAISPSQGTYVITSYAVAEAMSVPLTGWIAKRFGTVRAYTTCILMFGLFSLWCGFANSLAMLVAGRVMQGLSGGPLMPLSQTLLTKIFPREKMSSAMAIWSMTTLVAPVMGPMLGGYISDNFHWSVIFLINVPIAILCSVMGWRTLKAQETPKGRAPIDRVGLGLLIVWVACIQIVMDKGNEWGWLESPIVIILGAVAVVGFAAFMIWELTEQDPIVDLWVFRHGGYSFSVMTMCLTFGAYFGSAVLTPLWLQTYMGYPATTAGQTMGMVGMLAIFTAPVAATMAARYDPRRLVAGGVAWLAMIMFARSFYTTDATFWQVSMPLLIQGIGVPFFFVPLMGMALGSVTPEETASAAGLLNFARTLSGAFSTSLITTVWANISTYHHAELAGSIDPDGSGRRALMAQGFTPEQATAQLDQMLQGQSVMMATNHIFQVIALVLLGASAVMWFAPKPIRKADTAGAH